VDAQQLAAGAAVGVLSTHQAQVHHTGQYLWHGQVQ